MTRETLYNLLVRAGVDRIKATAEGWACVCPIHKGERPTLHINVETGAWQCFNPSCQASGGTFLFLRKVVKMSYEAATDFVRRNPTVTVVGEDVIKNRKRLPAYKDRHKKSRGIEARDAALLGLYSKCPQYMVERGFSKKFLREFDIGFDTEGFEHKRRDGTVTTLGADRVTFPVYNHTKEYVGLTRRAVDDDWPKYLHDFDKSKTLYCIERLSLNKGRLVLGVSEGPVDALRARQRAREIPSQDDDYLALHNMTATLGGGVGKEQAKVIRAVRPDVVVLAFDNDDAGLKATRSSIGNLRAVGLSDIRVLNFPSHDLGELDFDHLVDLESQSSTAWLFNTVCKR